MPHLQACASDRIVAFGSGADGAADDGLRGQLAPKYKSATLVYFLSVAAYRVWNTSNTI
ncbi:protein of unknown function [Hyphomicrobium sp. 1Nfss2.1]